MVLEIDEAVKWVRRRRGRRKGPKLDRDVASVVNQIQRDYYFLLRFVELEGAVIWVCTGKERL